MSPSSRPTTGTEAREDIRVSAVVLRDDGGRVLTVRKRGTRALMFPGGKPDPGESEREAAVRECAEEIGVRIDGDDLRCLGVFTAPAANEPDRVVHATVFEHPSREEPTPQAEIVHLEWIDPASDDARLAPLLRTEVFPLLRRWDPPHGA